MSLGPVKRGRGLDWTESPDLIACVKSENGPVGLPMIGHTYISIAKGSQRPVSGSQNHERKYPLGSSGQASTFVSFHLIARRRLVHET